jgi:prepilin-type N-terminal cleavage/methylation domain-containing protein
MKFQKGFSLIELMVCLVLSSIIILSLMLTTARHRMNHEQQALELQLENNLHYAKSQLEQAVRGAGYMGCGHLESLNVHSSTALAFAIGGTASTLKISYAEGNPLYLLKDMDDPGSALMLNNPFKNQQMLVISDCHSADIFSKTNEDFSLINHFPFQKAYKENAFVSAWNEIIYEVVQTKRKGRDGKWIYALYSKNGTANRQELVENIVQMDITYANSINDFNTEMSSTIPWDQVKTVRIKLKAAIAFKAEPLEKELTFFVTLRNRAP